MKKTVNRKECNVQDFEYSKDDKLMKVNYKNGDYREFKDVKESLYNEMSHLNENKNFIGYIVKVELEDKNKK